LQISAKKGKLSIGKSFLFKNCSGATHFGSALHLPRKL
jgi:hypothetical protein